MYVIGYYKIPQCGGVLYNMYELYEKSWSIPFFNIYASITQIRDKFSIIQYKL